MEMLSPASVMEVEEEQVEGIVSNKYILNSVYYYNVRVILYWFYCINDLITLYFYNSTHNYNEYNVENVG